MSQGKTEKLIGEIPAAKKTPLYRQIQQVIKTEIIRGILRKGDLVPSEKDLATKFHVSLLTAKNAILGLAEEGLVYRVRGKGTFVSDMLEMTTLRKDSLDILIGVILPTMKTQIDKEIVDFLEMYLTMRGMHMLIRITRESSMDEDRAIYELLSLGVKGVIIFPTESELYSESILRLTLDKFPLVLIDRYLINTQSNSVSSDNEGGAMIGVQYMLSQWNRKNIALISPEFSNSATVDRRNGFERALTEANLPIDKGIWCIIPLDRLDETNVSRILCQFLSEKQFVDAIFAVNSFLASEVSRTLEKLGKDIPILSFDKPNLPRIPYIKQNVKEICARAVDLLAGQLAGDEGYNRITVETELVIPEVEHATSVLG